MMEYARDSRAHVTFVVARSAATVIGTPDHRILLLHMLVKHIYEHND